MSDQQQKIEASFSTLVMSIGSSAALSMGLTPNPQTGKTETDRDMAQFNIELLQVLKDKTANNLSNEEDQFLQRLLADLQLKFVEFSKSDAPS